MSYSSKDLIKELKANGFTHIRTRGDHHTFFKEGVGPIVVPHPVKDLPKGTFNKIRKDAGLK